MEPTKQELKAARKILRDEARVAKKEQIKQAKEQRKAALIAKVEELRNQNN